MKNAIVLAALLCGCQQRTELMLGVITDIAAPAPLDTAHLRVYPNGDTTLDPRLDVSWLLGAGQDRLPGSFALNSGNGGSTKIEIVLTAESSARPDPLVTRRARLTLVEGKVLFMRMALMGVCMSRSDCTDLQTCREGVCVDKQVDATMLPPFDTTGAQVARVECGASVFQDTSTHAQIVNPEGMNAAPDCKGGMCIEGTCYLPPQNGDHTNPLKDGGATGGAFADMGVHPSPDGGGGTSGYGGFCKSKADCASGLICLPAMAGGMACSRMCTMPGMADPTECPAPSTGQCSLQGFCTM